MKTKNFGEFLNEEIMDSGFSDDELNDVTGERPTLNDQDLNDSETYDYDGILDIITSNSPEEAAEIIYNYIAAGESYQRSLDKY